MSLLRKGIPAKKSKGGILLRQVPGISWSRSSNQTGKRKNTSRESWNGKTEAFKKRRAERGTNKTFCKFNLPAKKVKSKTGIKTMKKLEELNKKIIPDPFTGGTQTVYWDDDGSFMMSIPDRAIPLPKGFKPIKFHETKDPDNSNVTHVKIIRPGDKDYDKYE